MFERFILYFIERPASIVALGKLALNFAGFLLAVGTIASLSTRTLALTQGIGRAIQPSALSVAELLPGLPTWWVPENVTGFFVAVLLGLAGVALVRTGRLYQRVLGH